MGQRFAPSVNPADPGQNGGDKSSAAVGPSSATSDAAVDAERFVRAVKGEAEEPASIKAESSTPTLTPAKRKVKSEPHEEEESKQAAATTNGSREQEEEEGDVRAGKCSKATPDSHTPYVHQLDAQQ